MPSTRKTAPRGTLLITGDSRTADYFLEAFPVWSRHTGTSRPSVNLGMRRRSLTSSLRSIGPRIHGTGRAIRCLPPAQVCRPLRHTRRRLSPEDGRTHGVRSAVWPVGLAPVAVRLWAAARYACSVSP
jgi:hypothetical protein